EAVASERDRASRIDLRHLDAVAELGTRGRRLLREKGIEPAALGHQYEGLVRTAAPASRVAKPELERVDAIFDHRLDRERELPHRAQRQPAAAGLVAGKSRAVDKAHARARARE